MGYGKAFAYTKPAEIFREHASLSGFENNGARQFDISALAGISDEDYDALKPVQWPVTAASPEGTPRLLADGGFSTPDGKARFIAVTPGIPARWPFSDYPMVLNTGRARDQWHTMTRTGKAASLGRHSPEPYVEIGAGDAALYGLSDGALARLRTELGETILRVRINADQRTGMMFAPIHWNGQFASNAVVGKLIHPAADPISGQPEFKCTPARIEPVHFRWSGLLLSRRPLALSRIPYWSMRAGSACHIYLMAGDDDPAQAREWAGKYFASVLPRRDAEYLDQGKGDYRAACFGRKGIAAALFISASGSLPDTGWLESLFEGGNLPETARSSILSGRAAGKARQCGPLVCACFSVGQDTIINAITGQGLDSVAAVGAALQAGTNCGSCRPEIQTLITNARARQAAE